ASTLLSTTICSHKASQLVSKLGAMAQKHYNLKSTTVTGIPMKEEQHSGSSANYDVEIFHSAEVHMEQTVANVFCGDDSLPVKKDGAATTKDTIHLKWCTPKNTAAPELQACIGCHRITPVEINSRPTACLISFLLQGRQVMLEQPKKSGGKLVSHILASHGGDIFIHCLATYRTPMEDPPSISEGCGGRVTDYRINDFGEFMKANRLAPYSWNKKKGKSPLEKGLSRLERCTRYWPMVISETLLCNMMQLLEPLPLLIMKETITENDVLECKRVIYRVQAMESRSDPLPVSMTGIRGKGPKREEQYRQVWAELETFLEAASKTSKMHEKVYECLRGTSPTSSSTDSPRRETPTDEIEKGTQPRLSEASLSWQEIDRYQSMTEREKTDFNRGDTNNEHFFKRGLGSAVTEQAHKRLRTDNQAGLNKQPGRGAATSLLSMWNSKMNAIAASRHEEFAGRLQSTGNKAELYTSPMDTGSNSSGRGTPVEEWL
ncbi:integrator complex subunit 13-like, partial [Oculina patagonica]